MDRTGSPSESHQHELQHLLPPSMTTPDPGPLIPALTVPRFGSPALAADVFDLLAVDHERRGGAGGAVVVVVGGDDGLPDVGLVEELHPGQRESPPSPSLPRPLRFGAGGP